MSGMRITKPIVETWGFQDFQTPGAVVGTVSNFSFRPNDFMLIKSIYVANIVVPNAGTPQVYAPCTINLLPNFDDTPFLEPDNPIYAGTVVRSQGPTIAFDAGQSKYECNLMFHNIAIVDINILCNYNFLAGDGVFMFGMIEYQRVIPEL